MLLFFVLTFVIGVLTINLWRARRKLPKGPTPLPLIGNFHQLAYTCWKAGGTVAGYNEFRKEFGKVFTIWLGPLPTVHIADVEVAHETHVKRANIFGVRYSNGGINYIRENKGVISSNGEYWQEHRRFALTTLRNFGVGRNIMEEKIMEEYRYRFQDYKRTNFKNGGIEVHASSCFDLLVGSIINTMLVSERFEQGDEEFDYMLESVERSLGRLSIFDSFTPPWILKSDWWQWRTKYVFGGLEFLLGMAKRQIERRVEAISNGEHAIGEDAEDFLDAFLIKMDKDKRDGIVDSSFNLDSLAIDLFDLWLAGQETTSTTMVWACVCLLNHPEVVAELRRELLEVTGGTRCLTLRDKPNTPYLNATINEIQRIASIFNTNIFRILEEDALIDGQIVSAGAVFTAQISLLHTDEAVFKDNTKFDPGRFMENNNLEKNLIAFGLGKRSCLGESLAKAELYLITGNLILDFDLEPIGSVPEITTTTPFGLMKRPPSYNIRFVPIENPCQFTPLDITLGRLVELSLDSERLNEFTEKFLHYGWAQFLRYPLLTSRSHMRLMLKEPILLKYGPMNFIREGRGIAASNGEFWQEHRRFALKTLRDFGLGSNIMEGRIMEEYNYRFQDFKKTNFKNGGIEVLLALIF
ncbi:hypothetical protein L3Y34_006900 [Caenorhabditis briggsae]|uniref:Cytochrome P450 n=1 Tax=Caenorhabditis briggsae TaxID=6238 RepID=A0AAE9A0Y4_CAEBR|nr:hypothetical protein L3Y34_006899 [Caenorhabditis briggsae]ULT87392.1 hypothetical protein L3Y34_006900 [Caenorhabditis briggsae]